MDVRAEMVANVWQIRAAVGQQLSEGDEIVVLESMKMEIPVLAPISGTLATLHVEEGQVVQEGDLIAEVSPPA